MTSPHWSPLTVIAPHPDRPGRAVLSNALSGKRLIVGWAALVDAIWAASEARGLHATSPAIVTAMRQSGLWDFPLLARTARALQDWWTHGWTYAVDTYLWSARASFYDRGAGYQGRRVEAVRSYLERDGDAPQLRQAGLDAFALPESRPIPSMAVGQAFDAPAEVRHTISLEELATVLRHSLAKAGGHR